MVIHKIGILPLARRGGQVVALIHKPVPKDGTSDVAWGLARGTRMYRDAGGHWVDARHVADAEAHVATLEAPVQTARREMQEELDVAEAEMEAGLVDIGPITYDSAMKGAYPIHWFSGWVDDIAKPRQPVDAEAVRWVTLDEVRAMADRGLFKASYLPVVEAIMARLLGAEAALP